MKKKIKKHVGKTTMHKKIVKPTLPSGRVIIISSFVAVLIAVFLVADKSFTKQVVLGTSIRAGFYNEGNISWQAVPGATGYNIYYGISGQPFTNAVRDIPATVTSYTLQALKKNINYSYQVSAIGVDNTGNQSEIWFSSITPITDLQGM